MGVPSSSVPNDFFVIVGLLKHTASWAYNILTNLKGVSVTPAPTLLGSFASRIPIRSLNSVDQMCCEQRTHFLNSVESFHYYESRVNRPQGEIFEKTFVDDAQISETVPEWIELPLNLKYVDIHVYVSSATFTLVAYYAVEEDCTVQINGLFPQHIRSLWLFKIPIHWVCFADWNAYLDLCSGSYIFLPALQGSF